MKEVLFAFQFIFAQETYFTEEGRITNKVDGRLTYDQEMLYLVIDGQIEDYYVTHIEKREDSHLVLFDNEGIYGILKANSEELYLDFTVIDEDGEFDMIKVKYKVTRTNLFDK